MLKSSYFFDIFDFAGTNGLNFEYPTATAAPAKLPFNLFISNEFCSFTGFADEIVVLPLVLFLKISL